MFAAFFDRESFTLRKTASNNEPKSLTLDDSLFFKVFVLILMNLEFEN